MLLLFTPSILLKFLNIGKIGFSIILTDTYKVDKNAKIGHFNLIKCNDLRMSENAKIGHCNMFKGYFRIEMGKDCQIGNFNSFHGGLCKSKCYCLPMLRMHDYSKNNGTSLF